MLDLASVEWVSALREGLGAKLLEMTDGPTIACFRAGPFQIAYPDFLVGTSSSDDLEQILSAGKSMGADMLRIQGAEVFAHSRLMGTHDLGSIQISDLQQWKEEKWEKARRARNREARSALTIREGRPGDGGLLYDLYCATLSRHGGLRKYTLPYFNIIAPHAALIAELDGIPCAFVCRGFVRQKAFYMHGGHSALARQHYASDQLFLRMIRDARQAGMLSFDFLPTPPAQATLGAYKRAWGGETVGLVVSDIALRPWRARALSAALNLRHRVAAWKTG